MACVTRESVEANRRWGARLLLPYPLLSDAQGVVARALGAVRPVRIAAWTIELMRRVTLLADAQGRVAAVWERVQVRGHAREVLEHAKAARRL